MAVRWRSDFKSRQTSRIRGLPLVTEVRFIRQRGKPACHGKIVHMAESRQVAESCHGMQKFDK
jgi:hypothetical protein